MPIFQPAIGGIKASTGLTLPAIDWTEKETGTATIACPSNTVTTIITSSQFKISDCGTWWVWLVLFGAVAMGATPPTDIVFTAGFTVDMDNGNGSGGHDSDVHHVSRTLLTANAITDFNFLFQLFGSCANPPNFPVVNVSCNPAGQAVTIGSYVNLSAWGSPAS